MYSCDDDSPSPVTSHYLLDPNLPNAPATAGSILPLHLCAQAVPHRT